MQTMRKLTYIACAWAIFLAAAKAASVVPPTFDQLVTEADTIITGQVTGMHSEYVAAGVGQVIKTYITLKVLRTMKGDTTDTITLELLGGQVNDEVLEISDMPKFVAGDREILFVQNNGQQFCPLVGMVHGRYRVRHDQQNHRDYVARENGVPLKNVAEVSSPISHTQMSNSLSAPSALTPSEFEQQILNQAAQTTSSTHALKE